MSLRPFAGLRINTQGIARTSTPPEHKRRHNLATADHTRRPRLHVGRARTGTVNNALWLV